MLKRKDEKIELLRNVSLFRACNDKELAHIANIADVVTMPDGAVLCEEGKVGGEFFIVADGKATATLRGDLLATFGPGSFFGEMSLLDHGPRAATVTAESEMTLLVLDPRAFDSLIKDTPSVAYKVLRTLAERIRDLEAAPTH